MPTVVVCGGEDSILPVPDQAAFDGRAKPRAVAGSGHMVHVEQPDAVVAAIEEAVVQG